MSEPLTLAAAGSVALAEGIKFLYAQAGELIKQWRTRRADAVDSDGEDNDVGLILEPPEVLGGGRILVRADLEVIAHHLEQLTRLRASLSIYADDVLPVHDGDAALLDSVAQLRDLVEQVLGVRITFVGERRAATGTAYVVGRVIAGEVGGRASGVAADEIVDGTVHGEIQVNVAAEGADIAGVRVRRIGRSGHGDTEGEWVPPST